MRHEDSQRLQTQTRLYARSKGLTLVAEGVVFTVGIIPLLYILRTAPSTPIAQSSGLYAASAAFFLFAMWVGLRFAPGLVDRAYYRHVGDVRAVATPTPDWARFVAPLCLFAPIGAAGVGAMDAWQATVLGLVTFGLYMYLGGRFLLREPATEMIGAMTVLLGGLVAGIPGLAVNVSPGSEVPWIGDVLAAQGAALGLAGWLGVGWILAALALHGYNRWLLAELGRDVRESMENGGSSEQ